MKYGCGAEGVRRSGWLEVKPKSQSAWMTSKGLQVSLWAMTLGFAHQGHDFLLWVLMHRPGLKSSWLVLMDPQDWHPTAGILLTSASGLGAGQG